MPQRREPDDHKDILPVSSALVLGTADPAAASSGQSKPQQPNPPAQSNKKKVINSAAQHSQRVLPADLPHRQDQQCPDRPGLPPGGRRVELQGLQSHGPNFVQSSYLRSLFDAPIATIREAAVPIHTT